MTHKIGTKHYRTTVIQFVIELQIYTWNIQCLVLCVTQLLYGAVLLHTFDKRHIKKPMYKILEIHYYNKLVQHKVMHTGMHICICALLLLSSGPSDFWFDDHSESSTLEGDSIVTESLICLFKS